MKLWPTSLRLRAAILTALGVPGVFGFGFLIFWGPIWVLLSLIGAVILYCVYRCILDYLEQRQMVRRGLEGR